MLSPPLKRQWRWLCSEDVRILGINDFYVTDGYPEFIEMCRKHGVFPLLNIELIGISKVDQEAGIRVNDPGNPGRTYISGKGLAYPSVMPEESNSKKLDTVVAESNLQVAKMIELLNSGWQRRRPGSRFRWKRSWRRMQCSLLRERHVAKAMRQKLQESTGSEEEFARLISKVYGGKPSEKKRDDIAGLEEELRARLLKVGSSCLCA